MTDDYSKKNFKVVFQRNESVTRGLSIRFWHRHIPSSPGTFKGLICFTFCKISSLVASGLATCCPMKIYLDREFAWRRVISRSFLNLLLNSLEKNLQNNSLAPELHSMLSMIFQIKVCLRIVATLKIFSIFIPKLNPVMMRSLSPTDFLFHSTVLNMVLTRFLLHPKRTIIWFNIKFCWIFSKPLNTIEIDLWTFVFFSFLNLF